MSNDSDTTAATSSSDEDKVRAFVDAGVPAAEISRQLGHASTAETLRRYAHLFAPEQP